MIQAKTFLKYSAVLSHGFLGENESKNIRKLGLDINNTYQVSQIHGNRIAFTDKNSPHIRQGFDGMLTDSPVFLCIRTADCLPVFFFCEERLIVCAVHAGWKGLLSGILPKAVDRMAEKGAKPSDIRCAIGPHIQSDCYKVDFGRVSSFSKKMKKSDLFSQKKADGWNLNLSKIAFFQLIRKGLKEANMEISKVCTRCDRNFASFRRDAQNSGRNISFIGLTYLN